MTSSKQTSQTVNDSLIQVNDQTRVVAEIVSKGEALNSIIGDLEQYI